MYKKFCVTQEFKLSSRDIYIYIYILIYSYWVWFKVQFKIICMLSHIPIVEFAKCNSDSLTWCQAIFQEF